MSSVQEGYLSGPTLTSEEFKGVRMNVQLQRFILERIDA